MKKPGISIFQKQVYRIIKKIPKGYVTTYGIVAGEIGCGSCRAVGQALKRNPFAPRVPCHRVIASDFSSGGFQGKTGGRAISRKIGLLKKEGVFFRNGKIMDIGKIYRF